ncbi:MAG: trypsin-like peptidase domain-containing protein [Chthoniobacterales bacterium]
MRSLLVTLAVALVATLVRPVHAAPPELIRRSLVRIQTVSQSPDYNAPWNAGHVTQGVGAGFVISDNRIMTNAHVVSDARFITVTKDGESKPYPASVLHIAHDCDLAILQTEDPAFFEGTAPLEFGGIPEIESTVSVYGYPIGGDRPSVTRGIVSRVDFQQYSHSSADSHLVIQIDAAINPGNSGGPVVQDGKVVGVAFQGYSGEIAQNTGYMIPTPVAKRFLTDIEDGQYDHYVDLALTYSPLFNPAARRALGLENDNIGVLVGTVFGGGSSDGIVEPGDVITAIEGHAVYSDGSAEIDGNYMEMAEIVERSLRGDTVHLDVLRDGEPLELEVHLSEPFPYNLYANSYDVRPRFVLFGGLLFQPVNQTFLAANRIDNQFTRYTYDFFLADDLYEDHPEIIVLSSILADPINAYAEEFEGAMVETVNGKKIRTLEDLQKAFAEPADDYVVEFAAASRPLVLEGAAVEAARTRILSRYGVQTESNLQP